MERPLSHLLVGLLNQSGGLGVGLVDASGLLVQGHGLHGGETSHDIASHLSHVKPAAFKIPVTRLRAGVLTLPQTAYVRWLVGKGHFVYVLVGEGADHKRARQALRHTVPKIEALLRKGSGVSTRQRLEQPRKFTGRRLVR